MRIKRIVINDADKKNTGIKNVTINFKSHLNVFVGKNGGGKTRTLNIIKNKISQSKMDDFEAIPNYMKNVTNTAMFNEYKGALTLIITSKIIESIKVGVQNITNQRSGISNGPRNVNFDNLIESSHEEYSVNELNVLTTTALSHFYTLATKLILTKTDYSEDLSSNWKKTNIYQQYKSLREKFSALIGKELTYRFVGDVSSATYDQMGNATKFRGIWFLNGIEFTYESLSEGEKTLFAYILILHLNQLSRYSKTKDSIIIIDEPETHLHPEAQIKLIEGLSEILKDKGQLIIATHSIPIISMCNSDNIFLVKNSEIFTPNSKIPLKALEDLIGLGSIEKYLAGLFHSVSQWAYNSFLIDCFSPPDVIETSLKDDPQYLQFFTAIKDKKELKMLDYGAGKGRLEKIFDNRNNIGLFSQIDAYDIDSKMTPYLSQIKSITNVYNKTSEIKDTYDIILMSNVLHEIPPPDWIKCYNSILKLLDEDGILIMLEDLELRKGECPHEFGYLVLNENEMCTFFGYNQNPLIIDPPSDGYKGRLLCAMFNAKELKQANLSKLKDTLNLLKKRSFEKSVELRETKEFYKDGRTYAFYAQQFINAEYTLQKI